MKNIYLYGIVGPDEDWGEIGIMAVEEQLKGVKAGEETTLYINSPGGSVFEGIAIYNRLMMLNPRPIVKILGQASSIASIIACAGSRVEIAESAFMLVHNPRLFTWATMDNAYIKKLSAELDKIKDSMIGIYAKKTGMDKTDISAWMDGEFLFNASECLDKKLADGVIELTGEEDVKALWKFAACNFPPRRNENQKKDNQNFNNNFQGANMTLEEAIRNAAKAEAQAKQFESEAKANAEKLQAVETKFEELRAKLDEQTAESVKMKAELDALEQQKKEAEAKAAEAQQTVFKNEIETLCAKLVSEAKLSPKEKEFEAALLLDLRNSKPESYEARAKMLSERAGLSSLTNSFFSLETAPGASADEAEQALAKSLENINNNRR